VLTRNKVTGNDIDKNKNNYDTSEVKEDLFWEDELVEVLKESKK